jgi:hypothetical protein
MLRIGSVAQVVGPRKYKTLSSNSHIIKKESRVLLFALGFSVGLIPDLRPCEKKSMIER